MKSGLDAKPLFLQVDMLRAHAPSDSRVNCWREPRLGAQAPTGLHLAGAQLYQLYT